MRALLRRVPFAAQVLLALVLGVLIGLVARSIGTVGPDADPNWLTTTLRTIGSTFVNLLRVIVIPLIITAVKDAWAAWQLITEASIPIQAAFNLVMDANPIGAVVLAVTALVAGIALLITYWDQLTGKVKPAGYANGVPSLSSINAVKGPDGAEIARKYRADQARDNDIDTSSGSQWGGRSAMARAYQAPNSAALKARSASYSGRLEIAGAPAGSKLTNSYQGAPAIRPELVGQN